MLTDIAECEIVTTSNKKTTKNSQTSFVKQAPDRRTALKLPSTRASPPHHILHHPHHRERKARLQTLQDGEKAESTAAQQVWTRKESADRRNLHQVHRQTESLCRRDAGSRSTAEPAVEQLRCADVSAQEWPGDRRAVGRDQEVYRSDFTQSRHHSECQGSSQRSL
jgi:hypothetical protein